MLKLTHSLQILLASICAVTSAQAQNLTTDESRVLNAFRPLYSQLRQDQFASTISVVNNPLKGESVVKMGVNKDGVCTLLIQVRDNPAMAAMLRPVAAEDQDAVVQAIVAHETAHCVQTMTGDALDGSVRQEAEADVFAILWTAQNNAIKLDVVRQYFWRLRTEIQDKADAVHDTAPVLKQLIVTSTTVKSLKQLLAAAKAVVTPITVAAK